MKKLVYLIVILIILAAPFHSEQKVLAETAKPPSTVRVEPQPSFLTTKTTFVEPLQSNFNEIETLDTIPVPKPAPVARTKPTAAIAGCGDNEYANYIYMHESGCRTDAVNSNGCTGIGQACPRSKLTAVCPDLDYSCENAFFTNYAISRYGSWENAYNVWQSKHWW